ncbi:MULTISPECIES: hypothetical protein [unclassified Moorena]|nr:MULTISPECIES: hypothetical protein [unclassified Moorena]
MAFGHATRTTFNLGLWPRYANNLQQIMLLAETTTVEQKYH